MEQELCCPNCETVMELRYHLHLLEHVWYECPICGHRAIPRDGRFDTPEDEAQSPLLS
jgi:hypothetical protein